MYRITCKITLHTESQETVTYSQEKKDLIENNFQDGSNVRIAVITAALGELKKKNCALN